MPARSEGTRRRILDFGQEHPDADKMDVHARMGPSWGSVVYNLTMLEKTGRFRARFGRGHIRLFTMDLSSREAGSICVRHAEPAQ